MIKVLAILTAAPGRRDELLTLFRANAVNVRAEAGCLEYQPFADAEGFSGVAAPLGPDTFVVVEAWADAAALKAHFTAPHMVEYARASKPLLAERKIHILTSA
jgi:quinol monooxygenase YgiN